MFTENKLVEFPLKKKFQVRITNNNTFFNIYKKNNLCFYLNFERKKTFFRVKFHSKFHVFMRVMENRLIIKKREKVLDNFAHY